MTVEDLSRWTLVRTCLQSAQKAGSPWAEDRSGSEPGSTVPEIKPLEQPASPTLNRAASHTQLAEHPYGHS